MLLCGLTSLGSYRSAETRRAAAHAVHASHTCGSICMCPMHCLWAPLQPAHSTQYTPPPRRNVGTPPPAHTSSTPKSTEEDLAWPAALRLPGWLPPPPRGLRSQPGLGQGAQPPLLLNEGSLAELSSRSCSPSTACCQSQQPKPWSCRPLREQGTPSMIGGGG